MRRKGKRMEKCNVRVTLFDEADRVFDSCISEQPIKIKMFRNALAVDRIHVSMPEFFYYFGGCGGRLEIEAI